MSCGSAGNCAAGGNYTDRRGHSQGFVAVERNGRWGKAIEVPGLGALNKGGDAEVSSVSCASAGNCAAGGDYTDRHGDGQGFVAVERNGRWGKAIEVPGLAALNKGGDAEVDSVSCASAGNCAAGGDYTDRRGHRPGVRGQRAERPLGQGDRRCPAWDLDTGRDASRSTRCRAPRPATARPAGTTPTATMDDQGFVVIERNGRWGKAIGVPGLTALNHGGAHRRSTRCRAPRRATARPAGPTPSITGGSQGFAVVERNGRWGKAIEVPGLGALNTGGFAEVNSVSCAPAAGARPSGTTPPAVMTWVSSPGSGNTPGPARRLAR